MSVFVVVVAAGCGARLDDGGVLPKQYRVVAGRTVLGHTLDRLSASSLIEKIVVVVGSGFAKEIGDSTVGLEKVASLVKGGPTRQQSVFAGLVAIAPDPPDYVLIHDGVRPLVSTTIVESVVSGLSGCSGVYAAVPLVDSLKRLGKCGVLSETLSRSGLYLAQTPQGFHFKPIFEAHKLAAERGIVDFVDDISVAEWAGISTSIVHGEISNIKITSKSDLSFVENMLAMVKSIPDHDIRCGFGYDAHAFADGQSIKVCGVEISYHAGLDGHSDADVGLHALTDAILGTIGNGDIGEHFPPSDQRWLNCDSSVFVRHALELLGKSNGVLSNVDLTIIAESPKIGPYRELMRKRVAEILGLDIGRISIKANTNEKMGFIGRNEGMAATACVTARFDSPYC